LVEHHADSTASLSRFLILLVSASVVFVSQGWVGFLLEPIVILGFGSDTVPRLTILLNRKAPITVSDDIDRFGILKVLDFKCGAGAVPLYVNGRAHETVKLTWLGGGGPLSVVLDDRTVGEVRIGD